MVAVPAVGCITPEKVPDSTICEDAAPAAGNTSSIRRLTTNLSGRNVYQAANSAIATTASANFHLYICISPSNRNVDLSSRLADALLVALSFLFADDARLLNFARRSLQIHNALANTHLDLRAW